MTSPSSSSRKESTERELLRKCKRALREVVPTPRPRLLIEIDALLAQPEGQNNAAGQEARLPVVDDVARVERPAAILSGGTQTAPVPAASSEKHSEGKERANGPSNTVKDLRALSHCLAGSDDRELLQHAADMIEVFSRSATAARWISVDERLPDTDGRLCIIYVPSKEGGKVRVDFEYYHYIEGWATDEHVTHWMPLPAAPSPDGNEEKAK